MRHSLSAVQLVAIALVPLLACTGSILAQEKIARIGLLTRPMISGAGQDEPYQRFVRTLAQQGWSEATGVNVQGFTRGCQSQT